MKECWFVVEVYFVLSLVRAISSSLLYASEPAFLVATIINAALVFLLSFYTFRGRRIASRLLAVHIFVSALAFFALEMLRRVAADIYAAYTYAFYLYLLVGATKLWRVKELPKRFTDPPVEA